MTTPTTTRWRADQPTTNSWVLNCVSCVTLFWLGRTLADVDGQVRTSAVTATPDPACGRCLRLADGGYTLDAGADKTLPKVPGWLPRGPGKIKTPFGVAEEAAHHLRVSYPPSRANRTGIRSAPVAVWPRQQGPPVLHPPLRPMPPAQDGFPRRIQLLPGSHHPEGASLWTIGCAGWPGRLRRAAGAARRLAGAVMPGPDDVRGRRERDKLTIAEVCADLGISRRTFYEWRAKGRAPRCITLPNGSLRIRRSEYQRWLTVARGSRLMTAARPTTPGSTAPRSTRAARSPPTSALEGRRQALERRLPHRRAGRQLPERAADRRPERRSVQPATGRPTAWERKRPTPPGTSSPAPTST